MNNKYGIDLNVRADFIGVLICKKQTHSWPTTYAEITAAKAEAPKVWHPDGDPDFPDFKLGDTRHWKDAYHGASEMLKIAKRFIEWDAGDISEDMKPGNYKRAKGVIPWEEGDENPEDVIRRIRDET